MRKLITIILAITFALVCIGCSSSEEERITQDYYKCEFKAEITGSSFRYDLSLPNNSNGLDFETYLSDNGVTFPAGSPLIVKRDFYNTEQQLRFEVLNGSTSVIYLNLYYKTNTSQTQTAQPFQVPSGKKRVIILNPDVVDAISSYVE